MTEISALKAGLIADIEAADTLDALEGLRVGALGKNGVVTGLLKTLGGMSPEERLETVSYTHLTLPTTPYV